MSIKPLAAFVVYRPALLPHALRFDGLWQSKVSGKIMAQMTAAHLVEELRKSDFVVMKKPATVATIEKHPPMTLNKHLTD